MLSVNWLLWGRQGRGEGLKAAGSLPIKRLHIRSMQPGRSPVGPKAGKQPQVTLKSILWLCVLLLAKGH